MSEPRLELYKRLLVTWNEKVNLIGPEARDHLNDHIEEALEAARLLEPAGDVLDFGSGGGLPAIPMAIVSPAARFHLVETDQRSDRLAHVLTRFPSDLRFSLATSRAVGYPEEWVASLAPFLAAGARVALFQGTSEVPRIAGFQSGEVFPLRRGFLVTLTVPRGTA